MCSTLGYTALSSPAWLKQTFPAIVLIILTVITELSGDFVRRECCSLFHPAGGAVTPRKWLDLDGGWQVSLSLSPIFSINHTHLIFFLHMNIDLCPVYCRWQLKAPLNAVRTHNLWVYFNVPSMYHCRAFMCFKRQSNVHFFPINAHEHIAKKHVKKII